MSTTGRGSLGLECYAENDFEGLETSCHLS